MWSVTIDQRSSQGGLQRHGPYRLQLTAIEEAVTAALVLAGLRSVTQGSYQITVTPLSIYAKDYE